MTIPAARMRCLAIVLLGVSACGSGAALDGGVPSDAAAGIDAPHQDASVEDASARDATLDDGPATPVDAGRIDTGPSNGSCGTWTGRTPIRALFVGNSQIDFWDLAQLVADLSASAPAGCPRIEGERFTRGGANLGDLWTLGDSRGRNLAEVIAAGGHDVVVIAESIDLVELRPPYPTQFVTDATRIVDATRATGAIPILYATPYIERPDTSGFHVMADDQLALGATLGITVAAGGLAWLRVWAERPGIDLYFTDRQHPGYPGSYVSALVIYAAITGATPIGLTNAPPTIACEDGPCPAIAPADAELFQRAAWAQHLATGAR